MKTLTTKLILVMFFFILVSSIQAKTISPEDYPNLIEEKEKNELRFQKNYANSTFRGQGVFKSASESGIDPLLGPGYMVNFFAGKVEIICATDNKKTIAFATTLDKGDLVQIDSPFNGRLSGNNLIVLYGCKISKIPKK